MRWAISSHEASHAHISKRLPRSLCLFKKNRRTGPKARNYNVPKKSSEKSARSPPLSGAWKTVREKGSLSDDLERYITFRTWAQQEAVLLKTYNTLAEAHMAWQKNQWITMDKTVYMCVIIYAEYPTVEVP